MKNNTLVLLLTTFLAVCCHYGLGANNVTSSSSALRVRITDGGINYALNLGEQIVNQKLKTTKLPGVRIEIDGGPGKGMVEIRKLQVAKFRAPTYNYQALPPSGLKWSFDNGLISIKGAWSAWYTFLVKISVDGIFLATADEIRLLAVLDVTRGEDGRPQISVPNCQAEVGDMRVKISGGTLPTIINMFRGAIETALKNAIEKQVCKQVQNTLVTLANKKIESLPPKIKVSGPFLLDYTLSESPKVTPEFVEMSINGAITFNGEPSPVPVPPLPETSESGRMLYLWASDFIPQSLFTSAHSNGLLKYEVSKDKTPQFAKFLRTSCSGSTCAGTFNEYIAEHYPNSYVMLDVWSAKPPTLEFGHQKSEINITLLNNMYVEPKSNDTLLLFFQVDIKAIVIPYIIDGRVAGNVSIESLEIHINETRIGEISGFELFMITQGAQGPIQDRLNKILNKGVPIPTYDGVQLLNPKITVLDRILTIESDVEYRPQSKDEGNS